MDLARDIERGAVRVHVLHHASEGPVTGAWMAAELRRHGYAISPGTLYPALHALEAEGLLSSSEGVEAGRAVRRYRATRAGRGALEDARRALTELADELLSDRQPVRTPTIESGRVAAADLLDAAGDALRSEARSGHDPRHAGALAAAAAVVDGLARMLADLGAPAGGRR